MAKVNRFDALISKNNTQNKGYLDEKKEDDPVIEESSSPGNKDEVQPIEEKTQDEKEAPSVIGGSSENPPETKLYYKFGKKEREIKSVKKNLLITPSNDMWLRNTSQELGISVNELVNQLIEAHRVTK